MTSIAKSKAQHTPGPWNTGGIANPNSDRPHTSVWGPTPVGKQSGEWIAKDVTLPNARLIAAAPDLLDALRLIMLEPHGCPMCDSGKLRNPDSQHWDACGFARAGEALEKAEGRS